MKHEKFKVTPLERVMDPVRCGQLGLCADDRNAGAHLLQCTGGGRRGLSSVNYLAYWGYASSVVTVVTAVLGPILGTLADTRGFKKPIFMLCLFVGVARLLCYGPCHYMAAVPDHLHPCKDRLFGQSGVLRFHAGRCDHAGADGRRVFAAATRGATLAAACPLWCVWRWCWAAGPSA